MIVDDCSDYKIQRNIEGEIGDEYLCPWTVCVFCYSLMCVFPARSDITLQPIIISSQVCKYCERLILRLLICRNN
jgi:hypothetical protein